MPTTSITYPQLTSALAANGLTYGTLTLPSGARVVVTQRGGRILGPFLDDATPALTWLNPALGNADALREFVASGHWNLGGERIWIAPEIQYTIQDRRDFWGTFRLPAAIDPGAYQFTDAGDHFILSQAIQLTAYNIASGSSPLRIDRRIQPVADPLRTSRLSTHDAVFIGYEQVITLATDNPASPASETWNLVQLNPGGTLMIPCAAGVEVTPYFGDVPQQVYQPQDGALRIPITGDRQYKAGIQAAYVTGRMAYHQTLADGRALLLARSFFNNPSTQYAEEPPAVPGQQGHSVHVYNDDGRLGGFGEMEANGQGIGGGSGRAHSTDTFTTWAYIGSSATIAQIGTALLGVA